MSLGKSNFRISKIIGSDNKSIREDLGNGCQLVDLGENTILARTEVLKKHPWDDNLKTAEHEDFFLRLKGHVNVASCNWFRFVM